LLPPSNSPGGHHVITHSGQESRQNVVVQIDEALRGHLRDQPAARDGVHAERGERCQKRSSRANV
jgi:hypothetical protein